MNDIFNSALRASRTASKRPESFCSVRKRQCGVVLVIALILLVLISLLAVTSLRNAASSESLANNVRTNELATQAADIALRYCEAKALAMAAAGVTPDSTPDQWKTPATWDTPQKQTPWTDTSTSAFVLPLQLVNELGMTYLSYKRPPECMVEKHFALTTDSSTFYVVTARGFGPQVLPADAARSRPSGSEVWLQSHIEFH